MAKKVEKKQLKKEKWESRFTLIGEAQVGNFTYKIDEKSEKSDWVYNVLNLGVDCGKNGVVYAELMGGYGAERDNVIYVHGTKESDDGRTIDDFENKFTVDWEDRFDEDILESIGSMCFITVGLEKDKNGKTFPKKFLSPYDAIAYIKEHLEQGTVVNVKGTLKYSTYNDNTQVKKEINSIFLSGIDDKEKYSSVFNQTMLLNKDSVGKPDKERGIIPIYAQVLDYTKMYKNKEVKQIIPFTKMFELEIDLTNKSVVEKWLNKILKVRKGITEITFEGELVEGGALVTATEEDLPDDIKELVEIGAYTLEEALAKCSESTGKERRMVLKKPAIKMVGDDGDKKPVIQKFEEKYTEEDLILDFMYETENEDTEESDGDDNSESESNDSDDASWLDQL